MQVDFLVIGQGISGSFLSYYLQKEKKSFLVIDNNKKNSASGIGAGIINPVTGRRMVTVWMANEFLPFEWNATAELGNRLGVPAFSIKITINFFPNPNILLVFIERI